MLPAQNSLADKDLADGKPRLKFTIATVPPHGQRTPFMSWLVHRRDMAMVTWDVSAADWVSHDGAKVAADVLERTEPGSIILLHDGIDGTVHADRSTSALSGLPPERAR